MSCNEDETVPDDAVRIGLLLPFTGEDAAIGTNYEHAVLMVEDEINRNGGIGGHPVAFIAKDTHSSADRAWQAILELQQEGVVAIIGPESTEIARTILPRLQQSGIPLISPVISGGESIFLDEGYKWFRLSPSASIIGRTFANRLWDDGVTELSLVYSNDDYNLDFIGALAVRFTSRGGLISSRVYLADGALSYADKVAQLKQGGTSDVVISASVEGAARFVNDLTSTYSSTPWDWYLSPLLETPVFPQNTFPGAVEGAQGVGIEVSGYDETFRDMYVSRWKTEPLDGAFFYYDAAALLTLSLEQVAVSGAPFSQESTQVAVDDVAYRGGIQVKWNQLNAGLSQVRAGQAISYSGLSGPILFDEVGEQQKAPLKYWSIVDGEVVDDVVE
ncbi:MAG: ABC transporter substrate-binding protein [Deltaproteobacteria bacterium]|nr:ABC transporter substrate-binding protein [Deltaproteobacteria bacterium]MBN2673755.1 ABC transporter substrate-binding protein [Deltaproteobacteria bacterium]